MGNYSIPFPIFLWDTTWVGVSQLKLELRYPQRESQGMDAVFEKEKDCRQKHKEILGWILRAN